jgi:hypothetical protein
MKEFTKSVISRLSIHQIGPEPDSVHFGQGPVELNPEAAKRIAEVLLKGFNLDARYQFEENGNGAGMSVKNLVENFFQRNDNFHELSIELAKEWIQAQPETVKFHEMIVCEYQNLFIDGKMYPGLGIFLINTKENFLTIQKTTDNFSIRLNEGVNLKKLMDCALMIPVSAHIQTNIFFKQNMYDFESNHLTDQFLHTKPVSNNFYQTSHQLNMLKAYIDHELEEEPRLEKMEKMNRSMEYFKNHEHFDQRDFETSIFNEPEQKQAFERFRHQYAEDKNLQIVDEFDIAPNAVKKKSHYIRSVIKLDKDFHIYVHGNRQNIIRGYDPERGKYFYQLFFDEES